MSLLKRIIDAVRDGAVGLSEFISEGDALQQLEQELRDVEDNLQRVKQDLTKIMALKMASSRELTTLKMKISEHEQAAGDALSAADETLALEHAGHIATLETDLEEQQQVFGVYEEQVNRLKMLVDKAERQTSEYERQLSMVKTTESLHKASEAITKNYTTNSSKILSARESLEKIKLRQQRDIDLLEASQKIDAATEVKSLAEQLEEVGITDRSVSAKAVLDRIKSQRAD